jgi:sec-independent protein translocase protein TatB
VERPQPRAVVFDFSLGELAVIGSVALIVLGPEKLPKVARTVGDWLGKAQRYVSQVKADINREIELAELKKIQEEARSVAQDVSSTLAGVKEDLTRMESGFSIAPPIAGESAASDNSWEGADESWQRSVFPRRYKPGPSVDELAEELARVKRQLALPAAHGGARGKYAPRARSNRPRIRR